MQRTIEKRYAGPPNMGHGGYVSGLLVDAIGGATNRPIQVTLRKPVPLDTPLELADAEDGGVQLRREDELIAEAKVDDDRAVITGLEVPPAPTIEQARAATVDSPSLYDGGRGVHPICFGCGNVRSDSEGLEVFAGPLEGVGGHQQVAGLWRPGTSERTTDGWIIAALDCPGAFAFISQGTRAGLLGRIVFQRLDGGEPIDPGQEHVVTGWQIGVDGRKMFAGTALFDAEGTLRAAAKATWFGFPAG